MQVWRAQQVILRDPPFDGHNMHRHFNRSSSKMSVEEMPRIEFRV